jgi:hypothetical protein
VVFVTSDDRLNSLGVLAYIFLNAALNRRMLPNPDANAMAEIVIDVSFNSFFANSTLCVLTIVLGEAPMWVLKSRLRCLALTPSFAESASIPGGAVSPARISFIARLTVADVPFQAGLPGDDSGRQRKQGLKPALTAADAVGK